MLNWKVGTARIPQKVTTLSISWLNSQFSAAAIHRGEVAGTWETSLSADTEPDFASLVREAVQKTSYHGTTVSLLLASSRLVQILVDVPPVTGSALNKIVELEARQQQLFSGEAAWTFQNSVTIDGERRIILHLLPMAMLDQFVEACRKNGLFLNSVLPVSAVLHQQLLDLPLEKGDVALLAAETGGSTSVIVGNGDGELLLVRTVLGTWNENAERLALDLKRTMSFITQQFGLNVNTPVWMFGPGVMMQAPLLQRQLSYPVAVSPVACPPDYWVVETAKLRPAISPNFIGLELQQAPRRRVFAWIIAICTAVIVLVALGVTALLHYMAVQESNAANVKRKEVVLLQAKHQELDQRNAELDRKQQLVKLVLEDQHPPVPAWVMGYLGEAVPPELVVTSLQVKWEGDTCRLHLSGTLQGTVQASDTNALTNAVAKLASRLATGPFHVTILHRSDVPERGADSALAPNQFSIEGVMK